MPRALSISIAAPYIFLVQPPSHPLQQPLFSPGTSTRQLNHRRPSPPPPPPLPPPLPPPPRDRHACAWVVDLSHSAIDRKGLPACLPACLPVALSQQPACTQTLSTSIGPLPLQWVRLSGNPWGINRTNPDKIMGGEAGTKARATANGDVTSHPALPAKPAIHIIVLVRPWSRTSAPPPSPSPTRSGTAHPPTPPLPPRRVGSLIPTRRLLCCPFFFFFFFGGSSGARQTIPLPSLSSLIGP